MILASTVLTLKKGKNDQTRAFADLLGRHQRQADFGTNAEALKKHRGRQQSEDIGEPIAEKCKTWMSQRKLAKPAVKCRESRVRM